MRTRFCGDPGEVKRTQREPQYSEHEMERFYEQVAKGYCWKQSADNAAMVREWVDNTLRSHDKLMDRLIDLAIKAGAQIRAGELEAPSRRDGLYDKYRSK